MTTAEILAAVKSRTGRGSAITSIDAELAGVLKAITTDYEFLQKSGTITTASGTREYSLPEYCNNVKEVLDEECIPIVKADFNLVIRGTATGEPAYYSLYGQKILFHPIPDDEYTITVYYAYSHPDSLDTILLDNRFKECVIEGVCYEVYKGIGEPELGTAHRAAYFEQLNILIPTIPKQKFIEYRDL